MSGILYHLTFMKKISQILIQINTKFQNNNFV